MINIPTLNMSFYMSNLGMYTIEAIRAGLRTATTRYYDNEIALIRSLKHGEPIRFIRTSKSLEILDSVIVFANNYYPYTNNVYIELPSYYNLINNEDYIKEWCQLEGWDESFAKSYFTSNQGKKLFQLTYSLYPPTYNNYSPDNITELKQGEIFTFGSNLKGFHGLGAAKLAVDKFGAIYGQAEGLQGQSYAIITTDLSKSYRPSVDLQVVKDSINKFIQFAKDNTHLTFLVTEVGCGLAGFTVEQVAPLFKPVLLDNISNVRLPKRFVRHIIVSSIEALL